jgi:hypothetical protein
MFISNNDDIALSNKRILYIHQEINKYNKNKNMYFLFIIYNIYIWDFFEKTGEYVLK